jgi:alpha-beta hydrolase superfamily lysophospholipase
VLYVHGWSDYFFQRDLADFWTSRGARFYALDLRKYGRSLRDGQTPGYIENLSDYSTEIGLAIGIMREGQRDTKPQRSLVLFGHSTGGLILSLWAADNPGHADAVILNSPWLEFQLSSTGRQVLAPIFNLRARFSPHDLALQADLGFYMRAQRQTCSPEELATMNLDWRPERSRPALNGWMRAILLGHAKVSAGLNIDVPVAVLLSARSVLALKWNDTMTRADTVLDVDTVAKASLRLGGSVTVERIDSALHDVFLSAQEPRAEAYARLERWITGWRAAHAMSDAESLNPLDRISSEDGS